MRVRVIVEKELDKEFFAAMTDDEIIAYLQADMSELANMSSWCIVRDSDTGISALTVEALTVEALTVEALTSEVKPTSNDPVVCVFCGRAQRVDKHWDTDVCTECYASATASERLRLEAWHKRFGELAKEDWFKNRELPPTSEAKS